MNEKRFYITDTGLGLDTESDEMYNFGDEEDFCRLFDKLNEQQATIIALKEENEQLKQEIKQYWKCRDKWKQEAKELKKEADYFERKKCEYWNMYNEAHSDRIILKKENEQLRKQCFELEKDYLIETSDISDKIFLGDEIKELKQRYGVDDDVFNFNSNCAKLYQIRSVSPNGVIRLGKKNYKAKWRMKDVREINNELPTREEFNRETYQRLRNKYHTKHWCGDDVLGRIIYNIYEGTFGDYL